jgi:hypothetical protein
MSRKVLYKVDVKVNVAAILFATAAIIRLLI